MSLNLSAVLGELSARRRSRPDMTVATMTVVAYFDDPAVGEWARDRVHALAVKHPSRAIVLDGTQDAGVQHVPAECAEHEDCVKTRGDWIELGVRGMDALLVESAVATLRLPEAPAVLLWVAPGAAGDPRFVALARTMRTIVFNTSVLTFDDAALRELVALQREGYKAAIADLAYLRLHPWQEAIAHFFDHPQHVEELYDIRRVEIVCGSDPEAYYLLGWLASRLEWLPTGPNTFRNALGVSIEFSIQREGVPRRIRRVEMHSSGTRFRAAIDDERAEAIVITIEGAKTHPVRARPINNIDLAALVERAILSAHNDRIFTESLFAAGGVLERRKD
ncbi:MAG TPA: glucose-6-phosphate dehydrogenase assembly protein OpcA [Verrucomicrobiae bacterium]|nr:glucose-6-phosphate dehydrogenase assembly protein OpcA [Verrucomicrobiae bacterium]